MQMSSTASEQSERQSDKSALIRPDLSDYRRECSRGVLLRSRRVVPPNLQRVTPRAGLRGRRSAVRWTRGSGNTNITFISNRNNSIPNNHDEISTSKITLGCRTCGRCYILNVIATTLQLTTLSWLTSSIKMLILTTSLNDEGNASVEMNIYTYIYIGLYVILSTLCLQFVYINSL